MNTPYIDIIENMNLEQWFTCWEEKKYQTCDTTVRQIFKNTSFEDLKFMLSGMTDESDWGLEKTITYFQDNPDNFTCRNASLDVCSGIKAIAECVNHPNLQAIETNEKTRVMLCRDTFRNMKNERKHLSKERSEFQKKVAEFAKTTAFDRIHQCNEWEHREGCNEEVRSLLKDKNAWDVLAEKTYDGMEVNKTFDFWTIRKLNTDLTTKFMKNDSCDDYNQRDRCAELLTMNDCETKMDNEPEWDHLVIRDRMKDICLEGFHNAMIKVGHAREWSAESARYTRQKELEREGRDSLKRESPVIDAPLWG